MSRQTIPNTYQDARSLEIIRERLDHGRGLGAVTISNAAKQHGASLKWLTPINLWATLNNRRVAISGHHGTESALSSGVVNDKVLSKELMAAAGVSVPGGRRVSSAEDAVQAQQEIGQAVVVKPVNGAMGRGVTVNVTSPEDIRAGFSRAAVSGARVLVEQYIEVSAEYRAHATSTECVGVFRRLLPSIIGNGRATVTELIEQKNELRRQNPSTRLGPIPVDDVAEGFLHRRGLTWNDVVPDGQQVFVRDVNGITSGGDSEECWETVSESVKQTAVGAVAAVPGMDWAGVDIVVAKESAIPYVIEVNTNAAINGSTFPVYGTPRNLGEILWGQLYARASPEPTQKPPVPKLLEVPQRLEAMFPAIATKQLTLRDLLERELQETGHLIIRHNPRIWSTETPGQTPLWFNVVLSKSDLSTAIHPIRRLYLLRRIMRAVDLPRAAARRIRRFDQLEEFREKLGTSVTLMSARKSLGRGASTIIESADRINESILAGKRNWIVQARYPGLRFSIIATPQAALAVMSSPEQKIPEHEVLECISTLAVSAVRAVPQLRWAVVDIVYRFPEKGSDGGADAVVEELSLNPTFDATSEVVAGSMNEVVDVLIAGAEPS